MMASPYHGHLIPPQAWENSTCENFGLTLSMLRFAISFFASVPIAILFRCIPTPKARHLYALITGFLLIYYPFGNGCIHALVTSLLTYLIMLRFRSHCGTLTWLVAFPYLIGNHIAQASGIAWKEGQLDFTGAQMVLTLKLVAIAMCYQDGARDTDAQLRDYAKSKRLDRLPTPLEFFSYLYSAGNLLSGPFFEAKDYFDYVDRKGDWAELSKAGRLPSAVLPGCYRFFKALTCAAVWMYFSRAGYNISMLESGAWQSKTSFPARLVYMWFTVVVYRMKYYFVWGVAESALIFSGLGFKRLTAEGKPLWNRYINSHIRGVEINPSLADTPRHWNVCTGLWLRHYVYERLTPPHRKPSFLNMVVTQLVSGVWHGIFPGYWLFFATSAFMFQASRLLYRYEQNWPQRLRSFPLWTALKAVVSALVLNYAGTAFMVLTLQDSWAVWRSMNFFGHGLVFGLVLVGAVMPPRRRVALQDVVAPVFPAELKTGEDGPKAGQTVDGEVVAANGEDSRAANKKDD